MLHDGIGFISNSLLPLSILIPLGEIRLLVNVINHVHAVVIYVSHETVDAQLTSRLRIIV
jgi:hypothetical protein